MASSRRSQALPQDFTRALSHHNVTSLDLFPQLTVPVPPLLAQQPVLGPIPDEPPPKNLEAILGNELSGRAENQQRNYIPRHFPCLPSKHTWQSTPVFPAREEDPRKIRERATEEGVLAEQALRKLMAAKKSGSQKRRPLGEVQQSSVEVQRRQVWEDALQAVMKEDEQERKRYEEADIEGGWEIDEANGDRDGAGVMKPDIGMLVNYDRKYWRKGAQERIAQV